MLVSLYNFHFHLYIRNYREKGFQISWKKFGNANHRYAHPVEKVSDEFRFIVHLCFSPN